MSLLLALTGSGSPDVSGTMAFTTGGIGFAGSGTETISGTLATTLGSVTFAGVGLETETGTLAFATSGITFAGVGVETETGTLAFTTDGILFAGEGNVTTADASGTLAFTTDSVNFAGQGLETESGQLAFTTDGIGFGGEGTVIEEEGFGGGSGYPVYGKYERPKGIGEFLDIAMSEIYEAATEDDVPRETKEAFVKVVKPYTKSRSKVPDVDKIDWGKFEKDVERVDQMLSLWQQVLDDEEVIIMAYLQYYH